MAVPYLGVLFKTLIPYRQKYTVSFGLPTGLCFNVCFFCKSFCKKKLINELVSCTTTSDQVNVMKCYLSCNYFIA